MHDVHELQTRQTLIAVANSDENSALEKRITTLSYQHGEMRKVAQAYDEIIRGSDEYQDNATSIADLQVEAGQEGLLA